MTKEKAIEELKEIIDEGWLISDRNKCTAIDACEMAIKTLEQEPRWIPVNEKRPVGLEKVLVTYRLHYDNSIHVGIGNITINDVNGRYHWNINEQDYIGWDMLAWMPLPQPYKAESEVMKDGNDD